MVKVINHDAPTKKPDAPKNAKPVKTGKSKSEKHIVKKPAKISGMPAHESYKNENKMYFMALGGLEHIGQNMYVHKYKGKYLVIDCGMGFLEEEIGAGDVQYCDTTWLEKRKKDVVGFVITHGHEDHIGALKFIWPKFRKPIHCTRFPAEILRRTFAGIEMDFDPHRDIVEFDYNGATLDLDPFTVETFHVTHSVP